MRRSDVARDDGTWPGLALDVRDRPLPGLWWVSGLDCHLILDSHARFAAAVAESVEPSLLQLHRTVSHDDLAARTSEAVGFCEDELARFAELRAVHGPTVPDGTAIAGPQLARVLQSLTTTERPTWSWPLPGGEQQ
ncbi:hypothetical protein [Streptomyces sp. NPDC058739]|uniref:hypothetical protein n=1 Tax=Streptomyces sp. NPDC058739 TaxID=3346618 RepID=UPI0036CE9983